MFAAMAQSLNSPNSLFQLRNCILLGLLVVFSTGEYGLAAEPPTLDSALELNAPKIISALQTQYGEILKKGQLNVGVLKVLARKGDAQPTDNIGPLNQRFTERLEVALILALKDKRIRILKDVGASLVQQHNKRANHLTEKGRKAFFDNHYTPAWGSEKDLSADVFLTGLLELDNALKEATVTIEAFDQSAKVSRVCTFKSRTESRTLTESGVSFARSRNALDELEAAQPSVVAKKMPIEFEVLYSGKPVKMTPEGVPEPGEKQKVSFRLTNPSKDGETYGVVLKINGESTLYPGEKSADDWHCYKWLLRPGATTEVTGYQMDTEKFREFSVLPSSPSDSSVVRYNEHAGTFQLIVFRAKKDTDKVLPILVKANTEAAYIARGFPGKTGKEETLAHLQNLLREKRENTSGRSRGFIQPGKLEKGKVKEVEFQSYPAPIYSLTLRYYKPKEE